MEEVEEEANPLSENGLASSREVEQLRKREEEKVGVPDGMGELESWLKE